MQLYLIASTLLIAASGSLAAPTSTTSTNSSITTTQAFAPQFSPSFPNINVSSEAKSYYNSGPLDVNSTLSKETLNLKAYPEAWKSPDPNHSEVQAVIKQIDWNYVPKASVRKMRNGDIDQTGYDYDKDPDCWWTSTNCVSPRVNYLPQDFYTCPKGEWGLSYDDGPFNLVDSDDKNAKTQNPYAEPQLYNFLAKENLKSTLFYIGSNVLTYPAAARRALSDGHTLCVHTWSHPPITSLTNEQAVAELYWTLKAIKDSTGITPRCFRPPQGDVDDRIRAIAWQMGMQTVLWDKDTQDWQMPAPGGADYAPSKVDAKFSKWIEQEKTGNKTTGVLVLEHELNHATVNMTEHWMPIVKETFNVVSAMSCNDALQPYWEETFKYPPIH